MASGFESLPVHDEAAALDIVEGERELLEEVIALFRESTAGRIDELRRAVDQSDLRGVANAAHSIKGAAANICAERVRALATEVEKVALAGEKNALPTLAASLCAEFDRFNQEVTFAA
ncbi:MAG: Hpt domain-containing protein [Planctomycetota bacterium]